MSTLSMTSLTGADNGLGFLKHLLHRLIEARHLSADARTRQRIARMSNERLRHLGLDEAQIDALRRTGRLSQRD